MQTKSVRKKTVNQRLEWAREFLRKTHTNDLMAYEVETIHKSCKGVCELIFDSFLLGYYNGFHSRCGD